MGAGSQQKSRNPVIPALSLQTQRVHELGRPELALFYKEQQVSGFWAPCPPKDKYFKPAGSRGAEPMLICCLSLMQQWHPGAAGFPSSETGSNGLCLMVLLFVCLVVSLSVLTGCSPCHLSQTSFLCWSGFTGCYCPFWCSLQIAGGWRPPAASGKHELLLNGV